MQTRMATVRKKKQIITSVDEDVFKWFSIELPHDTAAAGIRCPEACTWLFRAALTRRSPNGNDPDGIRLGIDEQTAASLQPGNIQPGQNGVRTCAKTWQTLETVREVERARHSRSFYFYGMPAIGRYTEAATLGCQKSGDAFLSVVLCKDTSWLFRQPARLAIDSWGRDQLLMRVVSRRFFWDDDNVLDSVSGGHSTLWIY